MLWTRYECQTKTFTFVAVFVRCWTRNESNSLRSIRHPQKISLDIDPSFWLLPLNGPPARSHYQEDCLSRGVRVRDLDWKSFQLFGGHKEPSVKGNEVFGATHSEQISWKYLTL
ncbi:hypothetical protein TNIN_477311 [Trichonephila inaurata madagascariensis]|uniref:Uncharacterized protein n=1 Tax=Trichonephila inaurata madagascariensis TaxID=2747483 RepID=A0A8X6I8K6_9ARAC|nr:hypothetical protein TNIN_477311 [Trichonephila inaurata madagascariensis]